jgi:hypothetical protein
MVNERLMPRAEVRGMAAAAAAERIGAFCFVRLPGGSDLEARQLSDLVPR